ncbi:hypothetical protein C8F01DRAFT_1306297 [Mycena amicta]|nr:hypothetical protein C8F01DRAFT_1306297 [Mycena amicta]
MSSHRPPSAKIPPEIVTEIFVCCLPASPASPSPRAAPLLLSQICARWRDIALDTPELWSNIVLKDDLKASVDILSLWSARARTIPLTFSLETQNGELGPDMLVAAMENSEHWRSVDLYLPLPSYAVLSSVSGVPLPHLRHLSLRVPSDGGSSNPDLEPLPRLDLSGASQLRELHLVTFPYTLLHAVPLRQLTTLHMDHYGTHLLEDLNILPLTNGPATVSGGCSSPTPRIPRRHRHLDYEVPLPPFSASTGIAHEAVEDLLPLIPKWGCTLEALELSTLKHTLAQLYPQLLAAIPSLKELHIVFTHPLAEYFSPRIVRVLNGDGLLPQLEALQITWGFSSEEDEYVSEPLRSFLRKKAMESKSVRVFKSFTLALPDDTSQLERALALNQLKALSDNQFDAELVINPTSYVDSRE